MDEIKGKEIAPVKTAVIYARYSSERQTEQSIEGQLRECMAYAEHHDMMVVDTYHNEIKAFFEKIYEDYIHLTFDDGEQVPTNEGLAIRYTLGYLPNGYTLRRQEFDKTMNGK